MQGIGRLLALLAAGVGSCWPRPAAADEPLYDELEGTLGSRPAVARFNLLGRNLNVRFSAGDLQQLDATGELATRPLSGQLASCSLDADARSAQKVRRGARLHGICELSEHDGVGELSFEGFWSAPGHTDERVVLTSRRTLARRLARRYGAQLTPPPAPANNAPPAGCAATPLIHAVARDALSKVAFILHSQHFECQHPDGGFAWSSYASALSVLDESAETPVLLSTTLIADPLNGANDVVDWVASLSTFWLSSSVLGVVVNAGGTISGSGVITDSNEYVFAVVGHGSPQLLLSVPGGSFGKSNIENASGEVVSLSATKPGPGRPVFFGVATSGWSIVDGVEQDVLPTSQRYRFDAKRVALVKVAVAPVAPSAWLLLGPGEAHLVAAVAPRSVAHK